MDQTSLKLSSLKQELDRIQNFLDHEGKMRCLCNYDEDDMKLFYKLRDERNNKRNEIEYYKRIQKQNKFPSWCCQKCGEPIGYLGITLQELLSMVGMFNC